MNKRRRNRQKDDTGKVGWRVSEWGPAVGVCDATVYNYLSRGIIEAVKVGDREKAALLIITSPTDFIAALPKFRTGKNRVGRYVSAAGPEPASA
jgi:hypothetical protein